MIECYTDEEILALKKPYLDLLEEIWKGGPTRQYFQFETSDELKFEVYPDGEACVFYRAKDIVHKYVKSFPLLETRFGYLAKTDALKEHLIKLISDRGTKIYA